MEAVALNNRSLNAWSRRHEFPSYAYRLVLGTRPQDPQGAPRVVARLAGPAVSEVDKSAPIPVELPMSQTKDAKVPDKVVPVPADDPNVATLADNLHANAELL